MVLFDMTATRIRAKGEDSGQVQYVLSQNLSSKACVISHCLWTLRMMKTVLNCYTLKITDFTELNKNSVPFLAF